MCPRLHRGVIVESTSRLDPMIISVSNFISLSHNKSCATLATARSAIGVLPDSSLGPYTFVMGIVTMRSGLGCLTVCLLFSHGA
jgi:hypothetical protein